MPLVRLVPLVNDQLPGATRGELRPDGVGGIGGGRRAGAPVGGPDGRADRRHAALRTEQVEGQHDEPGRGQDLGDTPDDTPGRGPSWRRARRVSLHSAPGVHLARRAWGSRWTERRRTP